MKYGAQYSEVEDVQADVNEIYQARFASHFSIVDELYGRLKSRSRPITDQELEDILALLPLELFAVSEELNKLKVTLETIRLKNKETKESIMEQFTIESENNGSSPALTKEYVNRMTPISMIPYELAVQVHTCVIDLVSSRIQFCKELIMSAKKIWDGRRSTEKSMPVSEGAVDPDRLPKYSLPGTYIK